MKYIVIVLFIFAACNNKKNKSAYAPALNTNTSKIKVYCWCFQNHTITETPAHICMTSIRVAPKSLVTDSLLITVVTDENKKAALKDLIFNSTHDTIKVFSGVDSRFMLLFEVNERIADTIVYMSDSIFCYNDKLLFRYSSNVMDSVRFLIGKNNIFCR